MVYFISMVTRVGELNFDLRGHRLMGFMNSLKKDEKDEFVLPVRGKFKGEITLEGNARINGTAVGTVFSDHGNIVCGPQSVVDGTVEGVDIAVFGSLNGDVTSKGQLSVFSGASLKGDVIASALVIENGASYTGSVAIQPKDAAVMLKGKSKSVPIRKQLDSSELSIAGILEDKKH